MKIMEYKILKEKTYSFVLKGVEEYNSSIENSENIVMKQFLEETMSLGAVVEEAQLSENRNDFIDKLEIAQNKVFKINYLLRLLRDCRCSGIYSADKLLLECDIIQNAITEVIQASVNN